jgi:cobalt-zinc-cadmium efflux system outer membrane protein
LNLFADIGKETKPMITKDNPARMTCAQVARTFLIGFFSTSILIGTVCYAQTAPGSAQQEAGLPKLSYSASALTLQQIQDLAAARNPTLLAAHQNLEGVRAQEIQAGVRANPYFTFAGSNVTLPAEGASNPYAYSAQVSRLFERGDKRRWRLDVARFTTQQTAAQLQDQTRQMMFSIKQAFTDMLFAKAALQLATNNLQDFRHEVDINKIRLDHGDIDQLDFKRLDLQLAQFESDEAAARINLAQASYQLQTLAGYTNPDDNFDIRGDLIPPEINDTLVSLEQKALDARPDYLAAQSAVRVADANVKLAYANGTTDPTLEGEYDRSGTDNSAGFSINIPLRLFDRNQGNKETSKYQATASRLTATAAQNQVRSDVAQAWIGYKTAKSLSDRYNLHYLEESKQILDIAQFAYEHGGIALIDYLDAVRDSRTVATNALGAYAQTWLAVHQLSFATAVSIIP